LPRLAAVTKTGLTLQQRRVREARRALAARGLVECVTYSFVPKTHAALFGARDNTVVEVANPISADLDAMRPSVLPSLLAAAARNAARGLTPAHLFEIGPQFSGNEPGQQALAAVALRAGSPPRSWGGAAQAPDAFSAKADALALIEALGGPAANLIAFADAPGWYHPGRSGVLRLGNVVVASFGELHPSVLSAFDLKGPAAAFEVFPETIPAPKARPTRTKPALSLSQFQAVERDFAFLVKDTVSAAEIVKAAAGADKALIERVDVFDVYAGKGVEPGFKSIAIAARLQPKSATLTEAEIEAAAAKIVAAVTKATGGTLRG
jgi:phenylalanyl-tRNA synthetase beta chain